ncbi:MAG: hypothetical protein ACC656_02850, partial [Candidatus Heimdallarchaeota archaeon]
MAYKVTNTENITINGQLTVLSGTLGVKKVLTSDDVGNAEWQDSTVGNVVSGEDSHVQFNSNGNLGSSSEFAWDETTKSIIFGTRISTVGTNSFSSGLNITSSGVTSAAFGSYTSALAETTFVGGSGTLLNPVIASGFNSFNFSENTDDAGTSGYGAYGNNSVILGGKNQTIPNTSFNSVAIGGDGIIIPDNTPNTVYVSNLGIYNPPDVDAVGTLNALVYDSSTGEVKQRSLSKTAGESNTASNLGTGTGAGGEGIFSNKVLVDLQFKSLLGGTGIVLSSTADDITIDGNVYTASAGINIDASNVISLDLTTYSSSTGISITETGSNIVLQTTADNSQINLSTPANGAMNIDVPSSFEIDISSTEFKIADLRTGGTGKGLEYAAHYGDDYSDYSLTDKYYVQAEITSAINGLTIPTTVTASNGLSKPSSDIQLGGALTKATTIITGGDNSFSFTGLSTFGVTSNDTISFTNPTIDIQLGATLTIDDKREAKNGLEY